jgi:hypothetical protein
MTTKENKNVDSLTSEGIIDEINFKMDITINLQKNRLMEPIMQEIFKQLSSSEHTSTLPLDYLINDIVLESLDILNTSELISDRKLTCLNYIMANIIDEYISIYTKDGQDLIDSSMIINKELHEILAECVFNSNFQKENQNESI